MPVWEWNEFSQWTDFLGREKRKRRKSYAYNCTEFAEKVNRIDHFHHFHPSPRKKKFGRTRCYKVETVIFFRGRRRLFSFSRSSASVLGTRQSHASILRLVISRPTLRRWNRRFSFLSLPFSDRNCSLFSKDQITQSFGCIQRNVTREHVFKKSEVFEGFEYALLGLNK